MKNQRKRLFFDIETAPNVGYFWQSGHEIDVGSHNILKERAIICIAWKWEGERKVHHATWDRHQNDKKLLEKFLPDFNSADEVVTHNGNRFDIPWVRARAVFHNISMIPNPVSLDTCAIARSKFKFNDNRLNYVATMLGVGVKIDTGGFDLWKEILEKKSKKALQKMVRYCKHDVVLTEKLFDKLNPYIVPKSRLDTPHDTCPDCGGDTVVNKYRLTAAGSKRVTLQCKDCGKYHTLPASKFHKARMP